jgi:flagellar hook-length control protein FliK
MSSILPSTAAPTPSAGPSPITKVATRHDEEGQATPCTFGDALARSLEPAAAKTDKPIAKAVTAQPTRRQAGNQTTNTQDLSIAMALYLVPIETRMPPSMPVGTETTADKAVPEATQALLNDLLEKTPAPGEGTNRATDAPGVAKSTVGPPLQASPAPISSDGAIPLDLPALAAQANAQDAEFSSRFSQRGDKDKHELSVTSGARGDVHAAAPHGAANVEASFTMTNTETVVPTGGQVAADAAMSTVTSTALPHMPATVTVQTQDGVAASNAPIPAANSALIPEVGSPEWGKALGQYVIRMGSAGHQVAELQLNPPGLGPLKVTLSMSDHQMEAMFFSGHSSVRAAVEAALPQLRATLADNGISLGNTSVGAESQQQAPFANGQGGQPERGAYLPTAMANTVPLLPARTVTQPARRDNGMRIDIYA